MADRLLILEDTPSQLRSIEASMLYPFSYLSIPEGKEYEGCEAIFPQGKALPALIIADFKHFSPEHMRLLQDIRASKPLVPVIVMVAFGDEETRRSMYKLGVTEVLMKPVELERISYCINSVLKMQRMVTLIARLERQVAGTMKFSDIIGYSAPIRHVISMGEHAAQNRKHVLIEGESGTGKGMMARAIHGNLSTQLPFVTMDCEHLPEQETEAYVFGTGGKLEDAGNGTLFLREVGGLPALLQERMVKVLEEAEAQGGGVRVISTSSVPLEPLIRKGLFSHALYRLIRKSYIAMPKLNERREDIPLLAQHFLAMHTARDNKFILRFSEDALRMLANSEWPGNVAQLSNLVYRCSMLCNHDTIDAGTLRLVQQLEPVHYAGQMHLLASDTPSMVDTQGKIKKLRSIEEEAIRFALKHYGGSMTKAAASLGIGRSTLYRRMMEHKDHMPRANQTTRPMIQMSSTDFS